MYTTYTLTIAAIKMLVRNRQALFFTLIMPLFIMLIFGYIGFDKAPTFDVGVVTHSPSTQTQAFVDQLKAFPTIKMHTDTLEAEKAELNNGNVSLVLDIPDNAVGQSTEPIVAYINAGKASEAQTVLSILNTFVLTATIKVANVEPLVKISQEVINANNLRYIDFLLPGLIALSIMQMSVFSVAFVFTQYKEKGVLKRLLATPMKPLQFVAANAFTRLLVALVQATIFIGLGFVLFHTHMVGSYWLLALSLVLGSLMFLGLGFTISGLAKTTDSVPVIANITVFPMMFLGGTFFPINNMPGWLQIVAHVLPLTYFSTAIREIMTKGTGFSGIWLDLVGMAVWGVILITLATITFRFQEKDN